MQKKAEKDIIRNCRISDEEVGLDFTP